MLELHTYLRTKIGSARRRRTLLGIFYLRTKDCVTTVTLIYFKILTQQATTPLPRQYPPLPGFSVAAKAEHRRKDGTLRHRSPPFAQDWQLLGAVWGVRISLLRRHGRNRISPPQPEMPLTLSSAASLAPSLDCHVVQFVGGVNRY